MGREDEGEFGEGGHASGGEEGDRGRIVEEDRGMEKKIRILEENGGKKGKCCDTKGAAHVKPSPWNGPKEMPWRKFASGLKNWAMAVNKDLRRLMNVAEKMKPKDKKELEDIEAIKRDSQAEEKRRDYTPDGKKITRKSLGKIYQEEHDDAEPEVEPGDEKERARFPNSTTDV